ncbi:MAG: TatD family hydrolase [Clostridiales bacterium]|nr:TatD family hydrolase [Clostridiales bacterium]
MGLVDSHCHLDDVKFESNRDEIIRSFKSNGIDFVITCGDSVRSSYNSLKLAQKYETIYATAGIHPHNAKDCTFKASEEIFTLLKQKRVVAVGEIGLDYHYDFSPRDIQIDCMMKQVRIAQRLNMPIVFHIREAFGDFLSLMRNKEIQQRGVMHCFSGSIEVARECLDNNMLISFTGNITFKNAHKLRYVVKYIPLEKMMIETDSPYMTPEPNRGKRNEPKHVFEVAESIAAIKDINLDKIINTTRQNAIDFFNINSEVK